MLEETLKSVRDAEAKAEEILKEADAKAASVLEDAKVKAQAMKEDTASKVRSLSQKTTQAVHKEGDTQLEMAAKEARKEIEALRELVVPKKPEALEAIISALVLKECEKKRKGGMWIWQYCRCSGSVSVR